MSSRTLETASKQLVCDTGLAEMNSLLPLNHRTCWCCYYIMHFVDFDLSIKTMRPKSVANLHLALLSPYQGRSAPFRFQAQVLALFLLLFS